MLSNETETIMDDPEAFAAAEGRVAAAKWFENERKKAKAAEAQ